MVEFESVWREFEANEITHSAVHYLLAVASVAGKDNGPRAADIARLLDVSRAAVSLQVKSLREQGLLDINESNRLRLTAEGADVVARVSSKREVLRVFLADVLGVAPATAEQDSCKIEHLISEESCAALLRMVRFLRSGHPAAADSLRAYRDLVASCPSGRRCDLCTEVCLLSLGRA